MHLINACEVINHRCECESLTDICRYSITEHYLHIVAFALQGLIGHSPLHPGRQKVSGVTSGTQIHRYLKTTRAWVPLYLAQPISSLEIILPCGGVIILTVKPRLGGLSFSTARGVSANQQENHDPPHITRKSCPTPHPDPQKIMTPTPCPWLVKDGGSKIFLWSILTIYNLCTLRRVIYQMFSRIRLFW